MVVTVKRGDTVVIDESGDVFSVTDKGFEPAEKPSEPETPRPSDAVRTLLHDSWQAHQRYRTAKDRAAQRDALRLAYDTRMAAHAADPAHADPAWDTEQSRTQLTVDTHGVLVAFYEKALSRG